MSQTQALEFTPTPDFPALQYLDRVDKGSMADRAGLKPGDFLLEVGLCPQQMYIFKFVSSSFLWPYLLFFVCFQNRG